MKYSELLIIVSSISLSSAVAVPLTPLISLSSGSGFLEIEDVTHNLRVQQQLNFERIAGAIENAIYEVLQSLHSATSTDTLTNELCNYINTTLQSLADEGVIRNIEHGTSEVDSSDLILFGEVIPNKTVPISKLIPSVNSASNPVLGAVTLKNILYNCSNNLLSVQSQLHGEQQLIPGVISLQNITFSFMTNAQMSSPVFMFTGEWIIAGVSFVINVHYDSNSGQFEIVGYPKQTEVEINLEELVQGLTDKELPLDYEIATNFQDLKVEANINTKTVVISAQFGEENKIFLILQRPHQLESNRLSVTIAMEIASTQFSTITEKAIGLDISDIPYFGTLEIPAIAVVISSKEIKNNWLKETFSSCPLLSKTEGAIEEGVTSFMEVSFTDTILKMQGYDKNIAITVLGESLKASTLLSLLPLQSLISLPPGLNQITNLHVTAFSLLTESRQISITVSLPSILTFFSSILVVTEPSVVITATYPDLKVCLAVNGNLTLAGLNIDVTIAKENNTYVLTASTDEINFADIIEGFAADILPRELSPLLSNLPFTQIVINEMTMKLPLILQAGGLQQIHISGSPSLSGFTLGEINAIIVRKTSEVVHIIEAIELPAINLANLLRQLIPSVSFDNIPFINQDLDINLVLSPKTLPNIKLFGEKFRDLDIFKGISFQSTLKFPSTCSVDPFCVVARYLLNTDSFNLHGVITNPHQFTLRATVDDISLGSALTISEAGIELQVDDSRGLTVGIVGVIELSSPSLTFQSRVFFSTVTSEVVLDMTMSGCWENALGIPFLDICNLHASVAMVAGVTLTGLNMGGQVRIGKQSCGRVITATSYVGINTVTPMENYFYANVNSSVTIPSLFEAFCITISLPRPLAQTGFPDGFRSSFSFTGKELPLIPLSIPQGFHFSGTVNILGLRLHGDMAISLPEGLNGTVELPVLNIGGLLKMYKSSSERSKGPVFHAVIHVPSARVNIEASGYLSTLGISLETTMRITNDFYELSFSGCMLGLFEADFFLSAPYGPFSSPSFQVRGSFKSDLFSQLEDLIEDVMEETANIASKAVDKAQSFLNGRVSDLRSAESAFRSAQNEVDNAEGIFDDAVREVNRLQDQLDGVCSTRSCSSVCIGCISGTTCCGTVWGTCVCIAPQFSSCCTRIRDPTCEALNAACELLKAPIRILLDTARVTLDASRHTLDIARIAFRAAEEVLSGAQQAVNLASDALEVVQDTYQLGIEIVAEIAKFGLTETVNIKEITFDTSLSVASTGRFAVSVKARLLGVDASVGVNLDLRDITRAAAQLADHVVDGLSGLF